MKIGDKVRFLNAVGGGTVSGFKGKDIILVEDSDGFEIPVLMRECILIEPHNETQVRNTTKASAEVQSLVIPKKIIEEYKIEETKEGENITVCLAYLPIDIKSISTTNFECYLVNDSNYFLSFNYMSRSDDGWTSRSAGVVEPNTKLFLEEFDRTQLNDMERICFQYLAYKKDKPFALKNTCSCELHLDTVKFYKLHSFRENDYFDDSALIYTIVRRDMPEKKLIISTEDLERAMLEKQVQRPRVQQIVRKEKSEVLEIDLHIDELLDSTSGLSSGDILNFQLEKFDAVMTENKNKKGRKIVFIHGKGDGVLKNAIVKQLKTKYAKVYFQDASFQEYGYGATMVTI